MLPPTVSVTAAYLPDTYRRSVSRAKGTLRERHYGRCAERRGASNVG